MAIYLIILTLSSIDIIYFGVLSYTEVDHKLNLVRAGGYAV